MLQLGIERSRLAAGVGGVALALGAATAATGSEPLVWAVTAATAAVAVLVVLLLLQRHLARTVLEPLRELQDALDHLAQNGSARCLPQDGAPIARALARRWNEASKMLASRQQQSQADLLRVETAFERIHAVMQALAEGVAVVDAEGHVVLANPAARSLMERDGKPLEGRLLTSLLPGGLGAALGRGLEQVQSGERTHFFEADLGVGRRFFDLAIRRLCQEERSPDFGHVVVLHDVTRKHEVARLKDEFLSCVSHELRTPLTNICSSAEILQQIGVDENPADWQEFVGIVTAEARRMTRLVDDLLDYSKTRAGRIEIECARCDLGDLIRTATTMFEDAARQKEVELFGEAVGTDLAALCDQPRLMDTVARLIENALKFTPSGGRVRVRARPRDEFVELSVADSGIGVRAEDRESVFGNFEQIGDPMTEKPSGIGLGLAICRAMVTAMGGLLWCDAADLGGAEFVVILPRSDRPRATLTATGGDVATRSLQP